jgi:exonuclease III
MAVHAKLEYVFPSLSNDCTATEEHCFLITSTIKRVEFVSDWMPYIMLIGHWCHIIVLNVYAPTEHETDDVKNSFYEELERVFDKFPKYYMKILLGDFNAKVGRNDIFKPTIGNESSNEINNDN